MEENKLLPCDRCGGIARTARARSCLSGPVVITYTVECAKPCGRKTPPFDNLSTAIAEWNCRVPLARAQQDPDPDLIERAREWLRQRGASDDGKTKRVDIVEMLASFAHSVASPGKDAASRIIQEAAQIIVRDKIIDWPEGEAEAYEAARKAQESSCQDECCDDFKDGWIARGVFDRSVAANDAWVPVRSVEDYPPQGQTVLWTRGSVVTMMGYLNGDGDKVMYPGGREFEWANTYIAWMPIPPYSGKGGKDD